MGAKSDIEWTQSSWTPLRARVKANAVQIASDKGYTSLLQIAEKMAGHVGPHCEHSSPGCDRCYSETNNGRCLPNNGTGLPFDRRARDLVDIFMDEKILVQPLHWKTPRKIFVCSQTDWAAEFVTDEMMDRLLAVAALCPQHTFQFLTKRADRLAARILQHHRTNCSSIVETFNVGRGDVRSASWINPLPNVHLGFSAEDQPNFDARWRHMRKLAAAGWFTWASLEPLLGPIDVGYLTEDGLECNHCNQWRGVEEQATRVDKPDGDDYFECPTCGEKCAHTPMDELLGEGLRWGVVGGESGAGARPSNLAWYRSLIDQFAAAATPLFVKQAGANPISGSPEEAKGGPFLGNVIDSGRGYNVAGWQVRLKNKKGGDMAEWPEWMRVRQYPEARHA